MQPGLDVQPERERLEQRVLPLGRQLAAGGRDADGEALRAERGGLGDRGDDRHRLAGVRHDLVDRAPGVQRVDDRDDLALAVADQAVRGLAVRRVQERLGEDRDALAHASGSTPRPGRCESTMRPSSSAEPLGRVVGDEQVAVEVDEVAERRELARRRDAERALDHAAEHDDEPERAGRVHHAHGLADAARLGQLEVDAVGVARPRRRRRAACGSPRRRPAGCRSPAARSSRNASRSPAGNGCSISSTPSPTSAGSSSRASASVQPSLASTRSGRSQTARIASSRSRSASPPSLTLSRR